MADSSEPNRTSQPQHGILPPHHVAHSARGEPSAPESGSQPDHISALLRSLSAEAASSQVTDAPALTDLLHRLAEYHTAERPLETPRGQTTQATPADSSGLPGPTFPQSAQQQQPGSISLSAGAQFLQSASDVPSSLGPESRPLRDSSATQPANAFGNVQILVDSPQRRVADAVVSHLLDYDTRQHQERDRLRDAVDGGDGEAAGTTTARVRLNRQFRSRQLPTSPAVASPPTTAAVNEQPLHQMRGETVASPQPSNIHREQHALTSARPTSTGPPRHSPPQLDPRPSVRLRLSDGSGDAGVVFGNRDRIPVPVPLQQFTADAPTGRMAPFFTAASDGGLFRPSASFTSAAPMVGFPDVLQPLSASAPTYTLRSSAPDPLQPFVEPQWPGAPVTVNRDTSSSASGSGSGSDGDRDAALFSSERGSISAFANPQSTAQHLSAESLAKHAAALPAGFALQLDVRLKHGLQSAREVSSTELTRVLQAYLHAIDNVLLEYEAAAALVAGDSSSMAPCAASLSLLCERVKHVCHKARSALCMQGGGRHAALLEAEKHLAAVLHGNVLHKTALFARCTIVPCVEDDVHVATLPAAHSSLLCAINNHVRTMRSTQLRRFQCRQGATAFAAAAASLVRAQPSVFKPCPTWIQARLTRPTEVMDYPALQVLVSASLPPLTTFSTAQPGRNWVTARLPPQAPGRGGGRPPGLVRPRGTSEARSSRGQRAALSISPAGGLGTDSRRVRGSGGGHRSTSVRTRPRPDAMRDTLPGPSVAEFPDSLVAYILELFGRTDPVPQGQELLREVGTVSRQHTRAPEGGQGAEGEAVAERVERHEDDEDDSIDMPELVPARPRSNAVLWVDEQPLLEGSPPAHAQGSIPEDAALDGQSALRGFESETLVQEVMNMAQLRHEQHHRGEESDVVARNTQPASSTAPWLAGTRPQHRAQDTLQTDVAHASSASEEPISRVSVVQRLLRAFFGST